ncbi:MAG TPA: molybdopterin-dependent oxidoreductase [Acidobacteriaceae bacterium]|nr:molybdopterin-dependent oxidoreductase [Acidobacteriaceae bacterium]
MSEHEREFEIVAGDAEMVRRESARRTRRSFLAGGIAATAGYVVWRAVDQSMPTGRLQSVLRGVIDGNAAVSRAVFAERGLSPTFPLRRAVPLRMNGAIGMERMLAAESWRLQVTGVRDAQRSRFYSPDVTSWEYTYTGASAMDMMPDLKSGRAGAVQSGGAPSVQMPKQVQNLSSQTPVVNGIPHVDIATRFDAMSRAISGKARMGTAEAGPSASSLNIGTPGLLLPMEELRKLPRVDLVTEFKCIEGWSQITQWGGVRLRDFIDAFPPAAVNGRNPRYLYMETPDGDYYCGFDMAAAQHPQSTLVMEMSGQPLAPEHGAPLRLHMPIKYGYKQIKRIGLIAYTDVKPDDFWTKLGYDWYAGL